MQINVTYFWVHSVIGVVIDSKVTFAKYTENLCRKTNQKLHALTRVANFMTLEKRRLLMKTFVFSQLNHCPLVWMSHSRKRNNKLNRLQERAVRISRKLNNKLNRLQERAVRIVYNDKWSTSYRLLEKDKLMTIHTRNIQYLAK